jgi:hypothetical protein
MTSSAKSVLQEELARLGARISELQICADLIQTEARSVEATLAQLRSTRLEIRLDLQ